MMGNCCPKCFGDSFLSKQILEISNTTGTCTLCASEGVALVAPSDIVDYFQQLADLYIEDDSGKNISDIIKNDWGLFQKLDPETGNSLVAEILDDSTYIEKKFSPANSPSPKEIGNWEEFRDELKHRNRYFPRAVPNAKKLEKLFYLFNLATDPKDTYPPVLYRARININTKQYDQSEMGKPPNIIASAGRANPIGISYLYVASNEKTAISEVRPHIGETLTIAPYNVTDTLSLLDLRNPKQSASPFAPDDDLETLYEGIEYLCRLGDELTKPVLRHKADLEYLPSQYLCEFIKNIQTNDSENPLNAYDGVIYKSSVGDGDNYAIFNESKLEMHEIYTVAITNTDLDFEKTDA